MPEARIFARHRNNGYIGITSIVITREDSSTSTCVHAAYTKSLQVYGVRIYGSPWQPEFGGWAYNLPRGRPLLDKWDRIPHGVDILITHGPPIGMRSQIFMWIHTNLCSLIDWGNVCRFVVIYADLG
jgi:hypothetical protein